MFWIDTKIKKAIKSVIMELIDSGEFTDLLVKAAKQVGKDVELGYSTENGAYIKKKVGLG